jgi:hypothetical protein
VSSEGRGNRDEVRRYLTIFCGTAPTAVVVYLIFHAVYTNLQITSQAVGDVDPGTKIGLAMGYVAMVGGTGVFAALALWSGYHLIRAWRGAGN